MSKFFLKDTASTELANFAQETKIMNVLKPEMTTETRINLLCRLGAYMLSDDAAWQNVQERASLRNPWFSASHVSHAVVSIAGQYLQRQLLMAWAARYEPMPATTKTVGIVMAGNIPLVGFHDFLCGFMSGRRLMLKMSSKDDVLLTHLIHKLAEWEPAVAQQVIIADRLNNCDAYIATGSNNTARYFEQYFGRYPHIIRSNRTSVALLDGTETDEELRLLAEDVFMYYGLGCRSVTQICVPRSYDFSRLLNIFKIYNGYINFHKYNNNYDYHLAIYLLNKVPYMSNESLLLVENELPFSGVSVLHYRYYGNKEEMAAILRSGNDIQTIVGRGFTPFGAAQQPELADYADGVDTMAFLCGL